jgi:hypothetical protein
MKFTEWLKKKVSQKVKDFISGKNDSVKLELGKQSIGHQKLDFKTGVHDSRPKKERTRSGQKRKWSKDWE